MAANGTPALEILRRAGVVHHLREYAGPARQGRARDERPEYGLEAAAALGVEPASVGKTLAVRVDSTIWLAVVPTDTTLDLKAMASAAGGRAAELATPGDAARATGYVIGGISPLGTRRRLPTIVDRRLAGQARISVSAGRRGLQVELAPIDLISLSGARVAGIGRLRSEP